MQHRRQINKKQNYSMHGCRRSASTGENDSGSNDRHAEHGGKRGDREEGICPKTLEVESDHGLPKTAPEKNEISGYICGTVQSDT